jgi:hypothetical protein
LSGQRQPLEAARTERGADTSEYLVVFNHEWVVPDPFTEEDLRGASGRVRALRAEMEEAGVLIFTGGLDDEAPAFAVDPAGGSPVFSDGPFVESKEHLGGFAVIDVADEEQARHWAGKVAVACGWPQEVHRFQVPGPQPESS